MRDSTVRHASRLHKHLYRLTRGRIGGRLADNDMLLLTTIGQSSDKNHTVPLLYLRNAYGFAVIASYGGRPDHPQWYKNLISSPLVDVQVGHLSFGAVARRADGEERRVLWNRAISSYPGYAAYQRRTEREIPIVILDRV